MNKISLLFGALTIVCSECSSAVNGDIFPGRKMFFDFGANDGSSSKYFITGKAGVHAQTEGSKASGGFCGLNIWVKICSKIMIGIYMYLNQTIGILLNWLSKETNG